jgi:hypothetical protein
MADVHSFLIVARYCSLISLLLVCRHTCPYQQSILLGIWRSRRIHCRLCLENLCTRRSKIDVWSPSALGRDGDCDEALQSHQELHDEGNGLEKFKDEHVEEKRLLQGLKLRIPFVIWLDDAPKEHSLASFRR